MPAQTKKTTKERERRVKQNRIVVFVNFKPHRFWVVPVKSVSYLKALTDHFEGGSRVYSFDPYW